MMNLSSIVIPDIVIVALLISNSIFIIMTVCFYEKQKEKVSSFDDASISRLAAITTDCTLYFMNELETKFKNNDEKIFISVEDILSYTESYIENKYNGAKSTESILYYKDLLLMFYAMHDSVREHIMNIIKDKYGNENEIDESINKEENLS